MRSDHGRMRPRPWSRFRLGVAALAVVSLLDLGLAQVPPGPQPPRPEPRPARKTDDLSKRLLRKAMKEPEEDVMATILRLMKESRQKMEVDLDPGPETQALQGQIVEKLDDAIKVAAKNRRRSRQPQPSATADKRRRGKSESQDGRPGSAQQAEAAAQDDAAPNGEAGDVASHRGDLLDIRRGWGNLPARERDELIQGINEEYLERYRAWIERYYKALQESTSESQR